MGLFSRGGASDPDPGRHRTPPPHPPPATPERRGPAVPAPGSAPDGPLPVRVRQPVPSPAAGVPPQVHPAPDLWASWQPLDPEGLPGPVFEPLPPTGLSYRPDTVCDGWSTPYLHLRLASVRGYLHRYNGRPREDDVAAAYDQESGTVVFAVADGVSSAQEPHVGSQLACRSAVDELLAQVRTPGQLETDWERLLKVVHWQLIEQARRILRNPDAGVGESVKLLGTTLVAGTATPTPQGVDIAVVSVGDSGVWQIKNERIHRLVGGKDTAGEGVVSSDVEPLPALPPFSRPQTFFLDPGSVVLVGTDGFGDAVGGGPDPYPDRYGDGYPHGRPEGGVPGMFVRELRTPVPPLGFAQLLDFSRETFDDDRTLLALWPARDVHPAGGGA